MDARVFILAGGRSSRMGCDKAFLDFSGKTLLEHALLVARSVTPMIRIVGPTEKFRDYAEMVEDEFPGQGPLGGIHAALRASDSDSNLMLAVDMPFVPASLLSWLLEQAQASGATVTIPRLTTGWQPLCAVYRREFIGPAERALRAGRNKIDTLFADVSLRLVTEPELARLGYTPEVFRNLNTPEDLERARLLPHC